jgi:AhpD family alkylhydroperoxidase
LPPQHRRKRRYHNLHEVWQDLKSLLETTKGIRLLRRAEGIDAVFRERLMLAVTEVNGCRYCRFTHAKLALQKGISESELQTLFQGQFMNSPKEEIPALLYAQHWAETNGAPDQKVRMKMVRRYGENTLEKMEYYLRMIRVGNLLGNTWDYALSKLSCGHLGEP